MKITHAHHFDAPIGEVSAMLADREFAQERAAAMGSPAHDVDVDAAPDGSHTTAVRASVPAGSIPAELRSLLGQDLAIIYTEAWEPATDDEQIGTFVVEIAGAPGHVSGAIGLRAEGAGTSMLVAGDVIANVPLVGAMIEKAVAGAVEHAFAAQLEAADAWLAR